MNLYEKLDKSELRELLIKGWMTHDAMWFANCMQECGIEKTNKINKAAVKSMAMIEVKRIKKAMGLDDINNFQDLKSLIENGFEIIKGDFMKFNISFPEENLMIWEISDCFAYQGLKKMGAINDYVCGIFDRADGWFDSLGIKYSVTPEINGCLLYKTGKCFREYRFTF